MFAVLANTFDHKVFYCSVDNECICLQCDEEGMLQVEDVHDLYGAHDEADTRVAFHVVHVEQLNPDNIVVRCNRHPHYNPFKYSGI